MQLATVDFTTHNTPALDQISWAHQREAADYFNLELPELKGFSAQFVEVRYCSDD
jgi:hypothetical protein